MQGRGIGLHVCARVCAHAHVCTRVGRHMETNFTGCTILSLSPQGTDTEAESPWSRDLRLCSKAGMEGSR